MALDSKYTYDDFTTLRWVNDLTHFNDCFNNQNNQFFGDKSFIPLSIKNNCYDGIHRLSIINYDLDKVASFPSNDFNGLKVWFVSDEEEVLIDSVVSNDLENIYYITLLSDQISSVGRLELRGGAFQFINYLKNISFNGSDYWNFITGSVNNSIINENSKFYQNIQIGNSLNVEGGYKLKVVGTVNIKYYLENTLTGVQTLLNDQNYTDIEIDSTFGSTTIDDYTRVVLDIEVSNNSYIEIDQITFSELLTEDLTYKYSECIKFVDDKDYLVLHTRNYFDKDGIKWSENSQYNWIRTTLPATDLGLTNVNPERELQYLSGKNTPIAVESRNDRTVNYEFLNNGNSRVLDSIEVLSGNIKGSNDQGGFFLNLIKLTPEGDMDRADDSMIGTMSYIKQRNDKGENIFVDDNLIFDDLRPEIEFLIPPSESIFTVGVDNDILLAVNYKNTLIKLTNDINKKIRIYKDEVIFEILDYTDIVDATGFLMTIKNTDTYGEGNYRIEIDDDFVLGEMFDQYGAYGINNWTFTVKGARIHTNEFTSEFN